MSRIHRYIANDFTVRAAFVDSSEAVATMQSLQQCAPLPTVGVGRAMTAALLMASHLKDDQEVGLFFRGNGPLSSLFAEAKHTGDVRGFCSNPHFWPENPCSLGESIGQGFLTVTRRLPFQQEPHSGTVELVSGEIGDDVASYLHQSQQIRSLIRVGVGLGDDQKVSTAGGILIEVMPGVEEEIIDLIETNAVRTHQELKGRITQWIANGLAPSEIVGKYLAGIPFTEMDHPGVAKYTCPCTAERVETALLLLPHEDLVHLIDEGKGVEVTCQMCGRPYHFGTDKVHEIRSLSLSRKSPLH